MHFSSLHICVDLMQLRELIKKIIFLIKIDLKRNQMIFLFNILLKIEEFKKGKILLRIHFVLKRVFINHLF